jgi:hydrogenase-1 operon protein HyaF
MNPNIPPIASVKVKFDPQSKSLNNLNVRSILVEIQQGLQLFYKSGIKRMIDLDAIPLTPFERVKLLDLLGKGEVIISLSSLGVSQIYETNFSALWVIKHHDEQGKISNVLIEITDIPEIVLSQKEELSVLSEELQQLIDEL